MREGVGEPSWLGTCAAFKYVGSPLEAERALFEFSEEEILSPLQNSSASSSSDESELCASPSSQCPSPMFRDIDWSCHSPDHRPRTMQPQSLFLSGRISPPLSGPMSPSFEGRNSPSEGSDAPERVVELRADFGSGCGLYGDLEFDSPGLGLALDSEDEDGRPSKRLRRPRVDDYRVREGEEPQGQKRTVLNILERARREGLKSNFHKLRDQVPELMGNKRVAKGLILRKAADHIRELAEQSRLLEAGLAALRREHERLQQAHSMMQLLPLS